jgi:hypothetical protein
VCVAAPEPEASALLALLLLTDARRDARLSAEGELVLLADQERRKWDSGLIQEGERMLEPALHQAAGPYQLHAAIAACHSCSVMPDWQEIEVPPGFRTGDPIGFSPERDGGNVGATKKVHSGIQGTGRQESGG